MHPMVRLLTAGFNARYLLPSSSLFVFVFVFVSTFAMTVR
jgi:hypothetical protein